MFEGKRDVILFAIDCSESMLEPHDDPVYEDVQTSHFLTALEAAIQVQKKKVIVGPNDAVGIMLFNTVRNTFLLLPLPHVCRRRYHRHGTVNLLVKGSKSRQAASCSNLLKPSMLRKCKSLSSW